MVLKLFLFLTTLTILGEGWSGILQYTLPVLELTGAFNRIKLGCGCHPHSFHQGWCYGDEFSLLQLAWSSSLRSVSSLWSSHLLLWTLKGGMRGSAKLLAHSFPRFLLSPSAMSASLQHLKCTNTGLLLLPLLFWKIPKVLSVLNMSLPQVITHLFSLALSIDLTKQRVEWSHTVATFLVCRPLLAFVVAQFQFHWHGSSRELSAVS